ncbi:MAG TPA: ATP synthase F1 subunit epsilon [Treponema sp.]|nr:ATP synthase F1 subunit epsilon [Treponema sp.]
MAALFVFEVHTPYHPFFSGDVEAVTLTLIDGEIGIYANHSPFTAIVTSGLLRVKDKDGAWRTAFISGGILEVKEHKTVLIVQAAEWPEEIDKERAIASGERAEEKIKTAMLKFETEIAREKLLRSQFRLKVAALAK